MRPLSSSCKKKKKKPQTTKQPQSLSQKGFTLLFLSSEIKETPKQAIGLGWSTPVSSYWLQSTV